MDMKTENWSGTAMRPVGLIIRQKTRIISRNAIRSARRVYHAVRGVLHAQSFPTPELDPVAYRLSIGGAVPRELRLSYADIHHDAQLCSADAIHHPAQVM